MMTDSYAAGIGLVLADLKRLGFHVKDLAQLRRCGEYRAAIPVLMKWLAAVASEELKEDIVRTLSMPWAGSDVAKGLIEEFKTSNNFMLKWAIGNGLSFVADDSVAGEILELVRDRRHGRSREMLVVALSRLKDPRAREIARSLLKDDEVQGHAVIALRKLRAVEALQDIAKLADHPKSWIRAEVRKTLEVLRNTTV
jgi:hypothetical protein